MTSEPFDSGTMSAAVTTTVLVGVLRVQNGHQGALWYRMLLLDAEVLEGAALRLPVLK